MNLSGFASMLLNFWTAVGLFSPMAKSFEPIWIETFLLFRYVMFLLFQQVYKTMTPAKSRVSTTKHQQRRRRVYKGERQ